ncbi:MAG: hypothetical protein MN733_08015, partial [Nitrososphaera sp.]|nr:hypothetical protein [Nitrososphaera sp.]
RRAEGPETTTEILVDRLRRGQVPFAPPDFGAPVIIEPYFRCRADYIRWSMVSITSTVSLRCKSHLTHVNVRLS